MFFFDWIKKILFQSIEEDISEEKDKLNLVQIKNIKEPKKENKSDKNAIIRLIAVISFFILMYFFIKFMRKEEKVFQNRSYTMIQKKYNKKKLKDLNTHQLINKNNIHVNKHLKIDLSLEHSNFVHLKIYGIKNRWEIPKEILNKEYFNDINETSERKNVDFKIKCGHSKKSFYFKLYQKSKSRRKKNFYSFTTEKNFLFSKNYINFESILSSDNIYGFGERIHNFKLTKGTYTIWPTNQKIKNDDVKEGQKSYGHQPIGLHKTRFKNVWLGFVFFNSNAQDIQIYKKSGKKTVLSHKTIGGIIDYYIIVNNSPEKVIKDIKYLIGMPALPPFWAFGYHQGGDMYKSIDEFKKIYKIYDKKEIPLDSMWIKEKLLNKDFAYFIRENFHLNDHSHLIISKNCGIPLKKKKSKKYLKIGNEYNLFVKSGFNGKNLILKYKSGKQIIPDFLDPEIDILWNEILFDIYNKKASFDGIYLENLPIILNTKKNNIINKLKLAYLPGSKEYINIFSNDGFNLNAITHNNMIYNNKPIINIYQSKHTFNFIKKLNKRPFIISQANSFGTGKYSFHFFSENNSQNNFLKYSISNIFTYNIFGIPFTGADICGYYQTANEDLCTRWYNIGSFYPFMRNNFSPKVEKMKYPWSFDSKTENIIKRDIQTRYSLLRYYYSQFFLISINEKGGFFKPVMFEFPNEKNSYENIEKRIMLGEAFLLCPFFSDKENNKKFYFPNANWNRYPSGKNIINYFPNKAHLKKRTIELSGKKEKLHIFLRGGYIIPMQDTFGKYIKNTFYLRQEKLNLIINPNHLGIGKGTIIFDNDEINTIKKEKYIRVELEFKNKILKIKTRFNHIKYIYRDDILNTIEIWRINELFEEKIINKGDIFIKIKLKKNIDMKIKGKYYKENNKMKIFFTKEISLFDINEIDMNG